MKKIIIEKDFKGKIFGLMSVVFILAMLTFVVTMPSASAIITQGYTHSYDYYTVSYDGEGDAIVRAKLMINNQGEEDINKLSLEVPGRNIIFYDVLEESRSGKTCTRYRTEPSCVQYDSYYNCEKYENKQTCDSWDLSGARLSKITNLSETSASESSILTIPLKSPILKGDYGAVTIVYRVPRQAKNILGMYNFEFRTIMDPKAKMVDNVRVAVNVENGLYLKGTGAEVNYRQDFFGASMAESLNAKMIDRPAYYDEFSQQIMRSSGYVKTATNLDPLESFSVKGEYSKSYFRTHIWEYILWGMLIIGVIGLIVVGIRRLSKGYSSGNNVKAKSISMLVIGTSALQAVGLTILWLLAWFILTNIQRWVGYQYASVISFLVLTLFALLILSVFFVPPMMIGMKNGVLPGVMSFVLCIVWLILIVFVIIGLLAAFKGLFQPMYGVIRY